MTDIQLEDSPVQNRTSTAGLTISERGFASIAFCDSYSNGCVLRESSTPNSIWLGVGFPIVEGTTQMHLTREMVAKLLPRLQAFVEKGTIDTDADQEQASQAAPGQD